MVVSSLVSIPLIVGARKVAITHIIMSHKLVSSDDLAAGPNSTLLIIFWHCCLAWNWKTDSVDFFSHLGCFTFPLLCVPVEVFHGGNMGGGMMVIE